MCPEWANKSKGLVIKCRIIIRTVRITSLETIRTIIRIIIRTTTAITTDRTRKTSRTRKTDRIKILKTKENSNR